MVTMAAAGCSPSSTAGLQFLHPKPGQAVELSRCLGDALSKGLRSQGVCCAVGQAAENYVERNIQEEGGGGYQAYNWDTCCWGVYVLMAEIQGSASPYPQKVQQP